MEQLPQLFPLQSEDSFSDRSKELAKVVKQVFISSILEEAFADTASCLYQEINSGAISYEVYFGLPSPTVGFLIQLEQPSLVPCLSEKKKQILQRAQNTWNLLKQDPSFGYFHTMDGVYKSAVFLHERLQDIKKLKGTSLQKLCDMPINSSTGVSGSTISWLDKISQGINMYGTSAFGNGGMGLLLAKLKEGACNSALLDALDNFATSIIDFYASGRANSLPAIFEGLFNSMELSADRLESFINSPVTAISAEVCKHVELSGNYKKLCNIVENTSLRTQKCFHKYFNSKQMVFHHGIELTLRPFKFVSLQSGYECKTLDCWLCLNGFIKADANDTGDSSLGASTSFWKDSVASFQPATVLKTCEPLGCSGTFNVDTCECHASNGGLSGGAVAAIVIVVLLVVGALIACGVWFYRKRVRVL